MTAKIESDFMAKFLAEVHYIKINNTIYYNKIRYLNFYHSYDLTRNLLYVIQYSKQFDVFFKTITRVNVSGALFLQLGVLNKIILDMFVC